MKRRVEVGNDQPRPGWTGNVAVIRCTWATRMLGNDRDKWAHLLEDDHHGIGNSLRVGRPRPCAGPRHAGESHRNLDGDHHVEVPYLSLIHI